MNTLEEPGWVVRICRPAFQDLQSLLPRYYARSELNRQLQKLKWWNSIDPQVIDLSWSSICTAIYIGRSLIVQERATEWEIER